MQRRTASTDRPVDASRVGGGPALAGVVERARLLESLDLALRGALPPALAPHCRVANLRGARLVFLASSPAVATRLRLVQDVLTAAASRLTGTTVNQLTVKVAPMPTIPQPPPSHKPLSGTAAEHLRQAAALLDDPELQDLFRRLASLA